MGKEAAVAAMGLYVFNEDFASERRFWRLGRSQPKIPTAWGFVEPVCVWRGLGESNPELLGTLA